MSVKVDVEKSDQSRADGNASFKKGKWSEAIGHYTNAIIYNPTNPVNYSNRAQAFLKIDKYQDAERDCTTCLALEKNNIKALYRRGLARKGLGKVDEAIQDLQQILSIDKSNETVKTELEELLSLQKDIEHKKSKPRRPITPPTTTSISTGARIQEIVEQTDSIDISSKGTSTSSANVDASNANAAAPEPAPPTGPRSFSSLRQQREGKKKAFVNGTTPLKQDHTSEQVKPTPPSSSIADPVSSATKTSTIAEQSLKPTETTPPSANPESPSHTTTPPPAKSSSSLTPPSEENLSLPADLDVHSTSPGASLLFLRHLSSSPSPIAMKLNYSLISLYPPEILSKILANLIEPDNLGLMLIALEYGLSQVIDRQEEDQEEARKRVKVLLEGLKRSKRWGMNYSMLSAHEKSVGEKVWKECGGEGGLR